MAALAQEPVVREPASPASAAPVAADGAAHAAQVEAESHFLRAVLVGMAIGAVVCAGVWVLIVVLAMAMTDGPLGPMMLVGAACGVFAGLFLGGAAGANAGNKHLEHAERANLRKVG